MIKDQTKNNLESEYTLRVVISEFPQYHKSITELFYESTNFIEICEDYVLCLESLINLKAENEIADGQKVSELQDLILELQKELLSKI
jgi:hypothetical protein